MQINYDNLDDDPALAFAQIVQQLDEQIEPYLERADRDSDERAIMLEYINLAIAAAQALEVEAIAQLRLPGYEDVYREFPQFSLLVKQYVVRTRITKARIGRIYSVELDDITKTQIRHYIELIKHIIDKSDLESRKKNSLLDNLNRFLADVDRIRTGFGNAMLALIEVADVAKKGAEALRPLTELVNSITALIGKAKSSEPETQGLPAPEKPKQIEGPKNSQSGSPLDRSLDDEIPF